MHISIDIGMDSLHKYIDLQEDDTVLYLGGRIDDDNLYPPGYTKYLKAKIKRLKPTKIICHTHWYAKKYYEKGILPKSTKIDMILVHHHHFKDGPLQTINSTDYSDHRNWTKTLIDKNPNIVYAMYVSQGDEPTSVDADEGWFREDYDLNNVKCFSFDRAYSPKDLTEGDLGLGEGAINATDGFAVINQLVAAGFNNLNIVGFTAFGSDEDQSYFTEYGPCRSGSFPHGDSRFAGKKYFDIHTSENQRVEADILKNYTEQKKINNLEDYNKLMSFLRAGLDT